MVEVSEKTMTKKKRKNESKLTPEQHFQRSLAVFSRSNDLTGALDLYRNSPPPHGLSSNHFSSLLHLCASSPDPSAVAPTASSILSHMHSSGVHLSEASLASAARIFAAATPDGGDRAFALVKEMAERHRLSLKLRTCSPSLLAYCGNAGDAEKAYEVERYMEEKGVVPEEAEIRSLLRVSAEAGRGEKVYEYLHKLRARGGCVERETGEAIERWFGSDPAAEVGKVAWDGVRVREKVASNGRGWHGEGWLGKGRWRVGRVVVGDYRCGGCSEMLKGVDIGCEEAERFAEAIASLAAERESASNFKQFQDWLDVNNGYEAVVDGANVGLYQQNFADGGFCLPQLEAVVKELYSKCQGKWPLVILHNKRLQMLMNNPSLKRTLQDWLNLGILYPTPQGSNDDWYWLYAAVKLKCLLLTNDEMRDHIFELLGSKFVPMWKERHQFRYTFLKGKLKLVMPPPYSIIIQESETGSWHVPLKDNCENERSRPWLCITRHSLLEKIEGTQIAKLTNGFKNSDRIAENGNGLGSFTASPEVVLACSTLGKRKDMS